MPLPKPELLNITHGLHDEPKAKQDNTRHVPARAEAMLRVPRHGRRVEDGDGQGDGPDPDHLEDPEAEEGEELVALVVEAVVLASLEDAEEEEAREAEGPEDEEEGGDDLAGGVVAAHGEG